MVAAASLAATWPVQSWLASREFAASTIAVTVDAAVNTAGARPLVAFVGTSQTMSALDALALERRLQAGGGAGAASAPTDAVVADIAVAGTHVSAYPALLRTLLARTKPRLVVIELGHIAHDQYGGAWATRNFVTDGEVTDALRGSARGRELSSLIDSERRFPWLAIPRTARVVIDSSGRDKLTGEIGKRMRDARGFAPYTTVKEPELLVRTLQDDYDAQLDGMVDASPQRCFVATATLCASICKERGVPMAVLVQPVNRTLAPRVPVLRHFEETARGETIPALRAAGIDVIVPPDAFFESPLFYDHVHLHAQGAAKFTEWVGGELETRLRSR